MCCFRKICKDRTLRILERILETIGSLREKLGNFHVTDSQKNCHSKTFSNLYFCFHPVSATILFQCLHWFSVHVIPGDFQKFPSESATQCPVLSMFLGPGSPNPQSLCVQDNNGQFDHILAIHPPNPFFREGLQTKNLKSILALQHFLFFYKFCQPLLDPFFNCQYYCNFLVGISRPILGIILEQFWNSSVLISSVFAY